MLGELSLVLRSYLEAEGLEKTYKFTQAQLAENVDQNTARKIFSLDLPDYGSYRIRYTRNGRNLVMGSEKGHLAMLDMLRMRPTTEFHANQLVRDVTFLHNNSMLAAAQKKFMYVWPRPRGPAGSMTMWADSGSVFVFPVPTLQLPL